MVRSPYACASFPTMYSKVYEFEAEEMNTQRYGLEIANGGWDAAKVEAAAWRG